MAESLLFCHLVINIFKNVNESWDFKLFYVLCNVVFARKQMVFH